MAMLTRQANAEIIFSKYSNGNDTITVELNNAEDKNGITKLNCSIIHEMNSDVLYDDIMIYDAGIKFIVNIYVDTMELWNTPADDPIPLLELPKFSMELVNIPEVQINEVDTRIPHTIDPFKFYVAKREKLFSSKLIENIKVGLKYS